MYEPLGRNPVATKYKRQNGIIGIARGFYWLLISHQKDGDHYFVRKSLGIDRLVSVRCQRTLSRCLRLDSRSFLESVDGYGLQWLDVEVVRWFECTGTSTLLLQVQQHHGCETQTSNYEH